MNKTSREREIMTKAGMIMEKIANKYETIETTVKRLRAAKAPVTLQAGETLAQKLKIKPHNTPFQTSKVNMWGAEGDIMQGTKNLKTDMAENANFSKSPKLKRGDR